MSLQRALASVGLIRPARRRAFCPACKGWTGTAPEHGAAVAREVAPPAVAALLFLVAASIAWARVIEQSRSMGGMAIGPGTLGSFSTTWVVMMAAMMLPTAMPLVYEFARRSERRSGWQAATATLAVTYLGVWLAFGVACYLVLLAIPTPWPHQRVIGGVALALAGVYALTPIKGASEARCRELCALHGPLPFNLQRGALVVGAKYGLSCIGCSAALMVVMVIVGMSSLGWAAVIAGMVLLYKLAPAPGPRRMVVMSAALVALGLVYALTA
jgi:predicted metal-binding membrane protein